MRTKSMITHRGWRRFLAAIPLRLLLLAALPALILTACSTDGLAPDKDPTDPATGYKRVIRGGSYATNPNECRSAYRAGAPLIDYEYLSQTGFRIVFNE